ncbi:hypothetical protein J577_2035 [Acinetobacter sp. 263903-1]|nr:hypothetical protein J520_1632 [Acinetobacter sp. 869535]KCX37005.1 hypothetical protein J577_2035 [Acinetobacter sp. 263903-1]
MNYKQLTINCLLIRQKKYKKDSTESFFIDLITPKASIFISQCLKFELSNL